MQDKRSKEITLRYIEDLGIKSGLIYRKYAGTGRVLNSYYLDESSDYGAFDPDNPTGYRTGQCIDVQVIEGVVYRRKEFYPGEIVEGICSYGGDVGVAGKPKVGDIVGFYLGYYAQVWERIEIPSQPDTSKRTVSRKISPRGKTPATLPVNKELSTEALKLEKTNPQKALKLYSRLESGNSKFHPDILAAGIIGFVLGFVLIFYGAKYVGIAKDSLVLPLIWYTIGLAIIELRWLPKVSRWAKGARLLFVPIMAIPMAAIKMVEVIFSFFIMILIAAAPIFAVYSIISVAHYFISGGPFVWFWSLSAASTIRWSIEAVFFTLSFLFLAVFDVSIPKVPSVRLILRVIRLKKREALSMLVFYLSLVLFSLGWYTDNVFYTDFITGITLSLVTGGLIGFSFAGLERDHLLANLYRLAKARCLICMNHDFETYFPLRYVHEDLKIEEPDVESVTEEPILKNLLYATLSVTDNRELKSRKTLFKWSPWGTYIGSHYLRGGIHFKNKPVSHKDFLEFTGEARRLSTDDKYEKYREIIEGSIENTENLEALS